MFVHSGNYYRTTILCRVKAFISKCIYFQIQSSMTWELTKDLAEYILWSHYTTKAIISNKDNAIANRWQKCLLQTNMCLKNKSLSRLEVCAQIYSGSTTGDKRIKLLFSIIRFVFAGVYKDQCNLTITTILKLSQ